MDLYILSVYKNHENPKQWIFDNCPMDQYFQNSSSYLIEHNEPYYYTPIFYGPQKLCSEISNNLKSEITEASTIEEIKENVYITLCNVNRIMDPEELTQELNTIRNNLFDYGTDNAKLLFYNLNELQLNNLQRALNSLSLTLAQINTNILNARDTEIRLKKYTEPENNK